MEEGLRMGTYKYYQFKVRVEQRNEDLINILDSILKVKKDSVKFYDDEDMEVPIERGLNIEF